MVALGHLNSIRFSVTCKGSFVWYARKTFQKTSIFDPPIRASTCVYLPPDTHKYVCISVGKKYKFFETFFTRTKWMIPHINVKKL